MAMYVRVCKVVGVDVDDADELNLCLWLRGEEWI